MKINRTYAGLALAIVLIIAAIAEVRYVNNRLRPNLDTSAAAREAALLLIKVGGVDKVCRESSEIFKRFGTTQHMFFSPNDLADYPSVGALGIVDGIWPDSPAFIKIRVGNKVDGYIIQIVNTNDSTAYVKHPDEIEVGGSCIYVHR